jgi:hypothetical protein
MTEAADPRRRARTARKMVGLTYGGVVTCLLIATVIGALTHSVLWAAVTLLALGAAIFLGGVVSVILSGQLSSVRSDLERLRARRAAGYGVRAKGRFMLVLSLIGVGVMAAAIGLLLAGDGQLARGPFLSGLVLSTHCGLRYRQISRRVR